MSVSYWDIPSPPALGDDNHEIIYEAVGRALSHWESAELELTELFGTFTGTSALVAISRPEYVSARIFKERADVIEQAAYSFFIKIRNQAIEGDFAKLIRGARLASARRNDIAHGIVRPIWYARNPGITKYLLLPNNYKTKEFGIGGQPRYSMSASQINKFSNKFDRLKQNIYSLNSRLTNTP